MESENGVEISMRVHVTEDEETSGSIGCENLGFEGNNDSSFEEEGADENECKDSYKQKRKFLSHGVPRKLYKPESGKVGRRYRCSSLGNVNRKNSVLLNLYSSVEETIDEAPEDLHREIHADSTVPVSDNNSMDDLHLTQSFPSDETDVVLDNNHSSPQEVDVVVDEKNVNGGRQSRLRKQAIAPRVSHEEENAGDTKTLCFLLEIHLRFINIGMIAHGLTGGVALAQCIFIFFFLKQNDSELLENYSEIALVFQSLYYILLTISTITIYDRYIDFNADFPDALRHIVDKPIRSVGVVSFFLALIFSVSLARLDDKISMYEDIRVTHYELITWKILNLLRVLTCIIGWITVALSPTDNITAITAKYMIARREEKDLLFLMSNGNDTTAHAPAIESGS